MQVIRALPRGSGDYIHPEEEVEILDEATGQKYQLMVKSEAARAGQKGPVVLLISLEQCESVSASDSYLIVTLSQPKDNKEATSRKKSLTAQLRSKAS